MLHEQRREILQMTRTARDAALAYGAVLVMTLTASQARTETTREACERISSDNAALRRCIADRTALETSSLEGKACSTKRCLIKMSCTELKNVTSCEGSGFKVRFSPIETGTEIQIIDDKGRITNMSRCGTCNDLDYDDGPLTDADIRSAGSSIILDVPK